MLTNYIGEKYKYIFDGVNRCFKFYCCNANERTPYRHVNIYALTCFKQYMLILKLFSGFVGRGWLLFLLYFSAPTKISTMVHKAGRNVNNVDFGHKSLCKKLVFVNISVVAILNNDVYICRSRSKQLLFNYLLIQRCL